MSDLLNNPAIQAGVLPFIVAVLIALIFRGFGGWAGLGLVAGFATTVALVSGFQFDPMTSSRKIVLFVLIGAALGLFFEIQYINDRFRRLIVIGLAIGAALWLIWPVLSRDELSIAIFKGLGFALFAAWMAVVFIETCFKPRLVTSTSAAATGFAIGGGALVGASALLGQYGLAMGSSALALAFVLMIFRDDEELGSVLPATAGLGYALIAISAVVYAQLPWYTLIVIGLIPLTAWLNLGFIRSLRLRAMFHFLVSMIPAGIVIYLTWQSAGPVPF